MKQLHVLGLFLLLRLSIITAVEVFHQCERDADCKGSGIVGYFCHAYHCESCVPCRMILSRANPPSGCARNEDECGSCLPGYLSDDLTNQRRSSKCFLIGPKPSKFLMSASFASLATGSFVLSILIALVAAVFILSNRRSRKQANKLTLRSLPPPYDSGSVRMSDGSYTMAALLEHENDAVPITEESDGSTETIPSYWEPADQQEQPNRQWTPLIKSQSLHLPTQPYSCGMKRHVSEPSLTSDERGRLDPSGVYQHRHVRLSSFRLSGESSLEPIPPFSFAFTEDLIEPSSISSNPTTRGFQDSGYFDNSTSSAIESQFDQSFISVSFFVQQQRDSN